MGMFGKETKSEVDEIIATYGLKWSFKVASSHQPYGTNEVVMGGISTTGGFLSYRCENSSRIPRKEKARLKVSKSVEFGQDPKWGALIDGLPNFIMRMKNDGQLVKDGWRVSVQLRYENGASHDFRFANPGKEMADMIDRILSLKNCILDVDREFSSIPHGKAEKWQ